MHEANEVIGGVGDHDAKDDVELECGNEASAPLGGGQFGNIHGAENRGGADAESADEAEEQERCPAPGDTAAESREDVEKRGDAERFAAAEFLADDAGAESADDGADQADADRESFLVGAETVQLDQGIDGPGDHDRIETEEESTEGAGQGRLHQVEIGSHRAVALRFLTIVHTDSAVVNHPPDRFH